MGMGTRKSQEQQEEIWIANAELAVRETELHPDSAPRMNVDCIEEMVTDKGYRSAAVLERVKNHQVGSRIPERQQDKHLME